MKTLLISLTLVLFLFAADAQARWSRDNYNNRPIRHLHSRTCGHEQPKPEKPIPEPSAALAFGAGLLILGRSVRRKRA